MIDKKKAFYCPHCGCIHLDECDDCFISPKSEIMADGDFKFKENKKVII